MLKKNKYLFLTAGLLLALLVTISLLTFMKSRPVESIALTPTDDLNVVTLHKNPRKIEGVVRLELTNSTDAPVYYWPNCSDSIKYQKLEDGEYHNGELVIQSTDKCTKESNLPTEVAPGQTTQFQDPSWLAYYLEPAGKYHATIQIYDNPEGNGTPSTLKSADFKIMLN